MTALVCAVVPLGFRAVRRLMHRLAVLSELEHQYSRYSYSRAAAGTASRTATTLGVYGFFASTGLLCYVVGFFLIPCAVYRYFPRVFVPFIQRRRYGCTLLTASVCSVGYCYSSVLLLLLPRSYWLSTSGSARRSAFNLSKLTLSACAFSRHRDAGYTATTETRVGGPH